MDLWLDINGQSIHFNGPAVICDIKNKIIEDLNLFDFYITQNGKILQDNVVVKEGFIHAAPRLRGGKGGFGSMLRAIGAQIEKTTNREACRDLSGRRLRDINEEKRLKNWIAQQAEREREAAERRKKKLERLCVEPKHDFSDQNYEKERSELTDKVYDAVEQGFRSASTSSACPKRKPEFHGKGTTKKKKTCLWVDDIDENDLSSLDSSDSDSEVTKSAVRKVQDSTIPANEGEGKEVCSTSDTGTGNKGKEEKECSTTEAGSGNITALSFSVDKTEVLSGEGHSFCNPQISLEKKDPINAIC